MEKPIHIRVEEDGNLPASDAGETGFNSQGSDEKRSCLGRGNKGRAIGSRRLKKDLPTIRHEGDGNLLARDARETQFNSGVLDVGEGLRMNTGNHKS